MEFTGKMLHSIPPSISSTVKASTNCWRQLCVPTRMPTFALAIILSMKFLNSLSSVMTILQRKCSPDNTIHSGMTLFKKNQGLVGHLAHPPSQCFWAARPWQWEHPIPHKTPQISHTHHRWWSQCRWLPCVLDGYFAFGISFAHFVCSL